RPDDVDRLGALRAGAARRRHGENLGRASLAEPRVSAADDREGLPLRSRRASRPLPRRVAARSRDLAHPGVARLSTIRVPQGGRGGEMTKPGIALILLT